MFDMPAIHRTDGGVAFLSHGYAGRDLAVA